MYFYSTPLCTFGLLTLVSNIKCQRTTTLSPEQSRFREALDLHDVIPKFFPNFPPHIVQVEWSDGKAADFGNIYSITQIEKAPVKLFWPVERKFERANSMFTFGMFGPDIPTREVAIGEHQWQHWLIINIPGNRWKEGKIVTEYRAYEPFFINDMHRILFIVYRQKGKLPLDWDGKYVSVDDSDDERGYFNWNELSTKYNFSEPYAMNFIELNYTGTEPVFGWEMPLIPDYIKNKMNKSHS